MENPVLAWVRGYVCLPIALVHGSVNHLFRLLHKVCRAAYAEWATVEHVGIDHGCAHILMAQELLDCADVLPPFQQVRRKGVAKRMATGSLVHQARIQMMTALGA